MAPKKQATQNKSEFNGWELICRAATRLGLTGTVIISLLYLLLFRASKEEQQAFIDLFFLLKFTEKPAYIWMIGFIFVALLAAQRYYYRRQLVIKDVKIDDLNAKIRRRPRPHA